MTQPKPCLYDRNRGHRIIRGQHDTGCPNIRDCDGCTPCLEPHCSVCGRRHLSNTHPLNCARCIGRIRGDLTAIVDDCRLLRDQAAHGGSDGRLWAAAPIPGGDAMVLIGPNAGYEAWANRATSAMFGRVDDRYLDDHRDGDPVPPLLMLARWEDEWRTALDQEPGPRASISRCVAYLDTHLTRMGQTAVPDFVEFARDIAGLRTQLEAVLHDERVPDLGVDCFECGKRLVRRHRDPKPCECGPRPVLQHAEHGPCSCRFGVVVEQPAPDHDPVTVRVYDDPIEDHVHPRDDLSCLACHIEAEWEAAHAGHAQGGLDEPTPGIGWECPSCRLRLSPRDYGMAVRRDLLNETDVDEWTSVQHAAVAASVLIGGKVEQDTIRKWMQRDMRVASKCTWEPGRRFGRRLVFWPDVVEMVTRAARVTSRRAS